MPTTGNPAIALGLRCAYVGTDRQYDVPDRRKEAMNKKRKFIHLYCNLLRT